MRTERLNNFQNTDKEKIQILMNALLDIQDGKDLKVQELRAIASKALLQVIEAGE